MKECTKGVNFESYKKTTFKLFVGQECYEIYIVKFVTQIIFWLIQNISKKEKTNETKIKENSQFEAFKKVFFQEFGLDFSLEAHQLGPYINKLGFKASRFLSNFYIFHNITNGSFYKVYNNVPKFVYKI